MKPDNPINDKGSGSYHLPAKLAIHLPAELNELTGVLDQHLTWMASPKAAADLLFLPDGRLPAEGYRLAIAETGITIAYADYQGAVWALSSLLAFIREDNLNYSQMTGQPRLSLRGYLLDISRDKLPTMASLREIIDAMMLLKLNHLELYGEGFSQRLPSFPDLPYDEALSMAEFEDLQAYARIRGIDLVPNINTFGHMTKWLALPKYSHLAESPSGFSLEGYPFPPSTLDPLQAESQELAKQIIADFLEVSRSPYFHVNGDEPFELGQGKSKAACASEGRGNIYLRHVGPLLEFLVERGIRPLLWGDVLRTHPEVIGELPPSTIIVDWGYDRDYDFSRLAKAVAGRRKLILAPGTSSWNSFTSRFKDMKASIDNALRTAFDTQALGMLLTDWGDFSHPQPLVISYPALVYFANMCWSGAANLDDVAAWTDRHLFGQERYAEIIIDSAGYADLEPRYLHNRTVTFASWMYVDKSGNRPLAFKHAIWINALSQMPLGDDAARRILALVGRNLHLLGGKSDLIAREITQALLLVKAGVLLNQVANGDRKAVAEAKETLQAISGNYRQLWLRRNRAAGLDESYKTLEILLAFLDNFHSI